MKCGKENWLSGIISLPVDQSTVQDYSQSVGQSILSVLCNTFCLLVSEEYMCQVNQNCQPLNRNCKSVIKNNSLKIPYFSNPLKKSWKRISWNLYSHQKREQWYPILSRNLRNFRRRNVIFCENLWPTDKIYCDEMWKFIGFPRWIFLIFPYIWLHKSR